MQWEFLVALVLGVPIILFPVAFVWYLNIGSVYKAVRKFRERRTYREERIGATDEEHPFTI